jgi:DNA-binding Lrp family transcriptional regulator
MLFFPYDIMQKTVESTTMQGTESAYMLINCELGSESSIIEQLKLIPNIKEARGVFGNYDILVKIQASSVESLREIVTFKIRKIPKIYCTTTIMCSRVLV